ncbi:hypothetical protein M406DRAFT_42775 [Cryphonectria parasitica EP155]|uniref:DNA mismatch repair protein n=1 Tax=Cryphonectria parasitica (strain ATCC 38755 / EP155) TaxID=660469 RepID=A0A9P4Y054_CRYP1|nr:uncharacterized protein M406DRAFT_42775 [Cryphonectria parasitica EP155]KAF3764233.1 hypothetical protein M406DRAFT_42775 [Cryphonectria parasitica EP155]
MGDKSSVPARTPAKTPSMLKKSSSGSNSGSLPSSAGKQQSILGFFSKTATQASAKGATPSSRSASSAAASRGAKTLSSPCLQETTSKSNALSFAKRPSTITPVPSSDAAEPLSSQENKDVIQVDIKVPSDSLPSPSSSPVAPLQARKAINYAESSEDEDVIMPRKARQARTKARARAPVLDEDDEDEYDGGNDEIIEDDDATDDMADFVVSDDSDAPARAKKRKRPSTAATSAPRKRHTASSPPVSTHKVDPDEDEDMSDGLPATSTAQQWRFDPDNIEPRAERPRALTSKAKTTSAKTKERACDKEPEHRHRWLAQPVDANQNPPGHPDYDPSTIWVPPHQKFSAFEQQYWDIKKNLWDTVVFFKKGKFYELYENDATIGHQLFDLKLTDRVNMRMVGVPESSLDMWVNQFVAKGYKVARVDQMESALGKEMRERDVKGPKVNAKDKIIRRELACILTGGTLVDGSMLQDDMAVYCAAVKESILEGKPSFGIAFVDAATGQFFLSEFEDDVDLTKFETFVAQISPRELLLEKSHISPKALRILKNNTAPTTIWNNLKSNSEFWGSDQTRRELDCNDYFASEDGQEQVWPKVLQEARDKNLLMSALGALTHYLRVLKLEKSLLSQQNFSWYSPIHKNGTLILDGQTLINLEIFSNNVNGSAEGTLFPLLNRCVTPFGKRLFRQWVCHPLCNITKINQRLDAVDLLNTDRKLREQFASELTKMPDLERLISRIHAGACKPDEFVKVLDGFEQIEYTMTLMKSFGEGNTLVDKLVSSMPNLSEPLAFWNSAFDRRMAREQKLLIPERGIEEAFDNSVDEIKRIKKDLDALLSEQMNKLKCTKLKFTDVGKEVYQVEVPKAVEVPKTWRQMSATAQVKRYYFRQLEELVRELQEAEETHSQVVKDVASSFFSRFDADNETWLQAIKVVSQLDCLVSLARASTALGQPSCRPVFVDEERTVVEFEELRHPCMLNSVDDFIPNDIKLGGNEAKINLLTGANAAGKSTVLRMSCIAVIMAQIGCYVPAVSARLTPVDRIMSRLGANDNIFAAQSTFFVELSETKKILSEATPRSLVILDELGRGTSSYDGVAVAQAVLHHIASHIGCVGFFATHYHSLATEFENHPEIAPRRMQIHVDDTNRRVTFLYKLEEGVAEGSFGMHCAAMCGISGKVIESAEAAAKAWEHTSRLKESLERAKTGCYIPLGVLSDVSSLLAGRQDEDGRSEVDERGVEVLLRAIEAL